jgi:site-specific DNA recombinase
VREFVDAGESARTADRPSFLDMVAFCKETPGIDVVLVYALDRFSRSRLDHALYKSMLKKIGIRVIATTTPLDESPEAIILEGQHLSASSLSERTVESHCTSVLRKRKQCAV